jgi:hypothetical protein
LSAFSLAFGGYGTGVDDKGITRLAKGNTEKTVCLEMLGNGTAFILIYSATEGAKCYLS